MSYTRSVGRGTHKIIISCPPAFAIYRLRRAELAWSVGRRLYTN